MKRPSKRRFTSKEIEVLNLLCLGLCDKEIAARLKIGIHTLRGRLQQMYRLRKVTRCGLIVIWFREGTTY